MESFLFCGRNWDYYFAKKNRDSEMEVIKNVVLTSVYDREAYLDSDSENLGLFLQYA